MPRRDYSTIKQTITAVTAATIRHDKATPAKAVSKFLLTQTGVNNGLAGTGVDSYKVKSASAVMWDITKARYRALLEALLSPLGGSLPATTALRFTLALDLYVNIPGVSIGLPSDPVVGMKAVETLVNASASAGDSKLAWEEPDLEPTHMSILRSDTTGIAASSDPGTYNVRSERPADDIFIGFILPMGASTAFIERMQVLRKLADGSMDQVFEGERDEIYGSQEHYNPETITDPFFWRLPSIMTMPQGSEIKLKTGASAAASDVIVPVYLSRLR